MYKLLIRCIFIFALLFTDSSLTQAATNVGPYYGTWNAKTTYPVGSLITENNQTYIAIIKNKNKSVSANTDKWKLLGSVIMGLNGVQVLQGIQGPKGDKGDTGVGIQGVAGPQGPQGYQGIQGPKGDVGITGSVGPRGPIGLSANRLTPILVDANGVYIATYLERNSSNDLFYGIIDKSDLLINFEYLTTAQPIIMNMYYLVHWDNNKCSGHANIVNITFINLDTIYLLKGRLYDDYGSLNYLDLEGEYYFNRSNVFTGDVYMYNGGACSLISPAGVSNNYVRPILNDPTVTGFDSTILKPPFRITTNY